MYLKHTIIVMTLLSLDYVRCAALEPTLRIDTGNASNSGTFSILEPEENHPINSTQATSFDSVKNAMISLMNQYRTCHGVNQFQSDSTVESQANSWAQELARSGQFHHSGTSYGENIYWQSWPLSSNGAECVKAWYCECFNQYNYSSENNSPSCGHFTQIVWKGSTSIGVGIAQGSKGTYVVANFNPAGNYRGRYTANVFEPDMSCVNSVGSCS